jgi:threonyl-tRNA synthetase
MIAILTEHTGGRWPFWLSPRQIAICTVNDKVSNYATTVYERLKNEKFYVELFGSNDETLSKKIRYHYHMNKTFFEFQVCNFFFFSISFWICIELRRRNNIILFL